MRIKNLLEAIHPIVDMSEADQLQYLWYTSNNGSEIKYIRNPSIKLQKAALARSVSNIKYLRTGAIDLEVLEFLIQPDQGGAKNIRLIYNPPEQIQFLAIYNDPTSIRYIENPSEQVQIEAVTLDETVIEHIKNPCDQALLIAIESGNIEVLDGISSQLRLSRLVQLTLLLKYDFDKVIYDGFITEPDCIAIILSYPYLINSVGANYVYYWCTAVSENPRIQQKWKKYITATYKYYNSLSETDKQRELSEVYQHWLTNTYTPFLRKITNEVNNIRKQ